MLYEFAPAKLNLYLHITGRRADGYHDLDSLAVFAGVGDEIRLEAADHFNFSIEGPQAHKLTHEPADNNLAVKAATSLSQLTGKPLNVKMTLVKNLPVASGIGGGSSDAAAALRALAKHWGLDPADYRLYEAAAQHGQDVPLCLKIENSYLTADGHAKGPELPYADIVLVNPNKVLPTPDVYKTYKTGSAPFSGKAQLEKVPQDLTELVIALKARKNDLYAPAIALMPEIKNVMDAINQTAGCVFTQMSGSGASCFGIYSDRLNAREAAAAIMLAHPTWWVAQSYIPCRSDPRRGV